MHFRFLPFLLIFITGCKRPQIADNGNISELMRLLDDRQLASGSLSITVDGEITYQTAIGFVSRENGNIRKPTTATRYRIGSVTKMFTAVMVLQLIEEGKLDLSQKLDTYFPAIKGANEVTIENMLRHRSGLHDYTKDTNFQEWMDQEKTREEMVAIISNAGFDFPPGTKSEYSNSNYLLLGYIVETINNKPYRAAVEQRILSKAGLADTYAGNQIDTTKDESISYKYNSGTWVREKQTNLSIHGGAGSLVSTANDLAKFIAALFEGKLLSDNSLKLMTNKTDGFGLGIFPFDHNNIQGFGHNGRVEEFYTALRYYPERKLAICYITNSILYPRSDIMEYIVKTGFHEDISLPFSDAPQDETSLAQLAGVYSSGDLPFKVTCIVKRDQVSFDFAGKTMAVEPVNTNYFMHPESGSFFEFDPASDELQIKETDNVYYLHREDLSIKNKD